MKINLCLYCIVNGRIVSWITTKKGEDTKGHTKEPIQLVILDMSSKCLNEIFFRDNVFRILDTKTIVILDVHLIIFILLEEKKTLISLNSKSSAIQKLIPS